MINQVDTSTLTAQQLAAGPIVNAAVKVRVLNAASGATIAFDQAGKDTKKLLGYVVYGPFRKPAPVWITGAVLVEYTTDASEDFDASAAGVTTISSFAGVDAVGTAPTANPVLTAGWDFNGNTVRRVAVDPSGFLEVRPVSSSHNDLSANVGGVLPLGALQVGGNDGTNLRALLLNSLGEIEKPNSARKTYVAVFDGSNGSAGSTLIAAAGPLWALEAPAVGAVRIRRIRVAYASAVQTTAGFISFRIFRTTAPSTFGTLATPAPVDPADAAFAGIVRMAPSATLATLLDTFAALVPVAGASGPQGVIYGYDDLPGCKPIVIPAGVANGIALQQATTAPGAAGGFHILIEFTVE